MPSTIRSRNIPAIELGMLYGLRLAEYIINLDLMVRQRATTRVQGKEIASSAIQIPHSPPTALAISFPSTRVCILNDRGLCQGRTITWAETRSHAHVLHRLGTQREPESIVSSYIRSPAAFCNCRTVPAMSAIIISTYSRERMQQ